MPSAEIVAIGSELLLGQIVDTNSAWMAQRLTALGVNLFHTSVVGDNPGRMADVIDRALDRADIVICGGGLGPTQDDITREVIAEVTGRELVLIPDELRTCLRQSQIMADPMNTGAAVRTYNVLLAENRAVAAALIAVD